MSKYFMLTYQYVPDIITKMKTDPLLVPEHLELAQKYVEDGKLLLGGTFADPLDSGAAVFRTDKKSDVEDFVSADPYVKKGVVTKVTIREWNVLVGGINTTS